MNKVTGYKKNTIKIQQTIAMFGNGTSYESNIFFVYPKHFVDNCENKFL